MKSAMVMFLHLSVSHSVHRGRGVPGQVPTPSQVHPLLGRYTRSWAGTPPGSYTPLNRHTPGRYTPWAGTPPRHVHPPEQVHPRAGTPHPWAGTPWVSTPQQVHPLGRYTPRSSACLEIRATSGRYASYWNVFLLSIILREKLSLEEIIF